MTMSKLPDLQSAVRRIDGVASATVRWPDPRGPATLRVEFAPEADRAAVTEQVIATLREIAGVDVDDIRLDMHPSTPASQPSAQSAQPERAHDEGAPRDDRGVTVSDAPSHHNEVTPSFGQPAATVSTSTSERGRPVFSGMTIDRGDLDTRVQVTLAVGASSYVGMAEGLATRRSAPRTAAIATLGALHELLPQGMRVQLEWLDVIEPTEAGRPSIVQAAVTCLSRAGEEIYIGSAIVRTDIREAAVRATLDALNRQLFRWRDSDPVAVSA